jgi:hypothetical protein
LLRWPKDGALYWKKVLQRIVELKGVVREERRIVVVGWLESEVCRDEVEVELQEQGEARTGLITSEALK